MLRSMPQPKRRPAGDDVGSETIPPPEYSRSAFKITAEAFRWHHTSAGMRSPHRWWSTIVKPRAKKNETISQCRFDSAGFGHGSLLLRRWGPKATAATLRIARTVCARLGRSGRLHASLRDGCAAGLLLRSTLLLGLGFRSANCGCRRRQHP